MNIQDLSKSLFFICVNSSNGSTPQSHSAQTLNGTAAPEQITYENVLLEFHLNVPVNLRPIPIHRAGTRPLSKHFETLHKSSELPGW